MSKTHTQPMKPQHFTSCGYLYLKTHEGQYSFQGAGPSGSCYDRAISHLNEIQQKIERLERQASALASFLDGETECSPAAMKP